nr:hypothetical protein [Kribbella amoyensis]
MLQLGMYAGSRSSAIFSIVRTTAAVRPTAPPTSSSQGSSVGKGLSVRRSAASTRNRP